MNEAEEEELIKNLSAFLSQVSSKRHLDELRSSLKANSASLKRDRPSSIPSNIESPGFPILMQAQLYLQQQRAEEAIELVAALESIEGLDPKIIDQGWLTILQHFFNQGDIFLDRNFVHSREYQHKR